MNDKMNWKNVLTIGGAYTAYCIGAGFASGQETLQYYASWGGIYPFVLPALTFVLMFVICYGTFETGYIKRFSSPNAAYGYYCGGVLGKILDIFCTIAIGLSTLIMFAGSGATVNQYLGAPVWVGTLVIVILIGVGIYCFCTADSGVMQAQQNVQQYVDAGVIMRANFLGIENPILAVTSLIGAYITLGLSFNVSLGGRCGSRREVSASAVISAVLFCLGLCMVLFTIIFNMDYIAQTGAQIPMLAAIQNMLPALALPFSVVILLGVFTTITGYLWAVGRRFAEDRTKKQAVVVVITAVLGVSVASVIPLDKLVNFIYPLIGAAGLVIFVGIVIKLVTEGRAPAAENK